MFHISGDVEENSAFSNTLQGPLELKIGSTDMALIMIYYRTDRYPDRTDKNELSSAWTKNPGDYIRLRLSGVGKNGTTLEPVRSSA